ncbi:MAG: hypothetical protein HY907_13595 [Deltaproteobacteria bacterium]|nr:hypothetical protein [Deltaproteobacteria bacterium]
MFICVHLWLLSLCALSSADEVGGDGMLRAPTLEAAVSASTSAPADALNSFLRGEALSISGHPREAFEAYTTAAELAVARNAGADAVVAGLALDAVMALVAYLPRSEAGTWRPPAISWNDPWWLWARLAAARYELAIAAITDDVDGVAAARAALSCDSAPWVALAALGGSGSVVPASAPPAFAPLPAAVPQEHADRWAGRVDSCLSSGECATRCGPFFGLGGPGFPGTNVAETELVANGDASVLVAVAGRERFVLSLDGRAVLEGDPALERVGERWLAVELPAGVHRLRLVVASDAAPTIEVERIGAGDLVTMRSPSGAEVVLGAGLRTRALTAEGLVAFVSDDPEAAGEVARTGDELSSLWLAASVARRAGDLDAATSLLERLVEVEPSSAMGWNALADALWSGDLPQELRAERLQAMQDEHAEALAGGYVASLIRVGLLYMEGRGDEAVAALEENVRAFPGDPGPALVDARLALGRGDLERARRSLAAAEDAAGRSCRLLDVVAELAEARGDAAAALAARREAGGCEPSFSGLVEDLFRAGRLAEAATMAEHGARTVGDPLLGTRWRTLIALAQGDPVGAADAALQTLRLAPSDGVAALDAYDALVGSGRAAEAAALVERLAVAAPSTGRTLDRLAAPSEAGRWPLREDGVRRVLLHEASGTAGDPPRLTVLDQAVVVLRGDGSRVTRIHRLERAGTAAAAEDLGQLDVPAGAEVIAARVIRADGSVEWGGERLGATTIPLGSMRAGDYADLEYAETRPASAMFPGGAILDTFFFAAPGEWMERSEYVVVGPAELPVAVDEGPGTPAVERADVELLAIRRWLARDVASTPLEPWCPDAIDVLPNVRACVGCTMDRAVRWMGEDVRRRGGLDDSEVPAAGLEPPADAALRALYAWVAGEVRSRPSAADTARDVFLRREGDRTLLLYHLARQAGLDAEFWYASPEGRGTPPADLWLAGDWSVPLLRLGGTWVYPSEDFVPFGAVPPNVEGRPAVRIAPAPGAGVVTGVEEPPREFVVRLGLRVEAGAPIGVTLHGLAAVALRQALAADSDRPLERVVGTYALPAFGDGPTLEVSSVEPRDDAEQPLRIEALVHLPPDAAGRPGLAVRHRWQDRFAALPVRSEPLLILVPTAEEWTIVPACTSMAVAATVVPLDLQTPFGSFRQAVEWSPGAVDFRIRRSLRLPTQRIEPEDYAAFRAYCAAVDAAVEEPIPADACEP